MKKVLAVLLSIVMVLSCCAVLAYAEDAVTYDYEIYDGHLDGISDYSTLSGKSYIVPEGKTLTVPAGTDFLMLQNSTVYVAPTGALQVNGGLVVRANASLKVAGRLGGAANVTVDTQGEAVAEVRFPNLQNLGLADKVYVSYAYGYTGGSTDDLTGNLEWHTLPQTEATPVWAPLNQYLYVKAHIIDPGELAGGDSLGKYDDAKFGVWLNDVPVTYTQDQHSILIVTSGDITYSKWPSDDPFIAERQINLRGGEGYTVYSRDGRTSANEGLVYIKYGQPFSFRVDIDDEYSMSAYSVYVVKGTSFMNFDPDAILDNSMRVDDKTKENPSIYGAYKDKDGYYVIPKVEGDYTVFVLGVIKNETVEKVSNIFEMVKNVFEMIAKFFRQFFDMFKFGN